ncbi:hypothetical protein Bca101_077983 [Brassica carinata]
MHEVCNTTSFDTLSNEVTINADKSVGRLPYLTKPTSTGDRSSSVGMCTVEAAQLDRPCKSGEKFGYDHPMGGLTIPCPEDTFINVTSQLQ